MPYVGNCVNFHPGHPQKTKNRDLLSNGDAIARHALSARKPAILATLRPFVNPKFRFYSEIPKKPLPLGGLPQFLDSVANGLSILRIGRFLKKFLQFTRGASTVAALLVEPCKLEINDM